MAKPDRVVVAGLPHHITNRGNRRELIFKETEDYQTYLRLLRRAIERYQVRLWSYALMPNHVHLVAIPRSFPRAVSARNLWPEQCIGLTATTRSTSILGMMLVGHLWQGRFRSS